ncbi:TetR/AcrR family transcriptional regulator [Streptomyces sp. TRM66268-LWL]|uniref:TetR/AcrR family transcriptional regulator n=1 Tax=Streptomyces polyasparticus TaxID=2767826 RepID=A0ABR7SD58_9ACTN|nr:TetR/AcrR family transcriptional regulator [Streptomyces polyasparticus]MBC9712421.1 TetR/AcrR family transcriptional regulator [Streptomyces polyasparticus]
MSPKDRGEGRPDEDEGESSSRTPAVRGRPRSEAVERAIIEGVMRLLEEGVSLGDMSIERIARTAGVGKATIYRRWKGKEELFVEVMRVVDEPDQELAGDSVRDDLVAVLEGIRRRGLAKRSSAMLQSLLAQAKNYPQLWELYHGEVVARRRARLTEVLQRGVASGELRGELDLSLMADLFTGPMLARTILSHDAPLPDGLSEAIVDTVIEGLRA